MNNTDHIPHSDLRMLCDLRAELEIFSVQQICRMNKKKDVYKQLAPILQKLKKATVGKDYAAFMTADRALHRTVVELANFPVLLTVWETVWTHLSQFHHESVEQYWPDLRVLMREHEYLINTICFMDLSAAEDGIRTHLQAIWFRIANKEDEHLFQQNPLIRTTSYIAFHLQHPLILKQLAAEVAFTSAGHLSKLFRDRYGKSFQSYVQEARINKAASLLKQTDLPVALIAQRVGYQDVSRFAQHFRRYFGSTPNRWRHGHKDKNQ